MWIQSYIFFPVLMLAWVMPIYARGRASYERLFEIYDEPVEVKNKPGSQQSIPNNPDIEFDHLTFSYPGTHREVLKNFTMSVKSGTFVGITGPVGSGKTTLFRLLNREYEIPYGKIFIGGQEIHDYSIEAIGKDLVTVEQLPFLFSRSIADNVRFGRIEAPLDEVLLVSKYADLHETVLDFPEQYETIVGERGVTLSGGQKQRVAMARGFLIDGSILLLDDVFSAVDAKTEARIFEALEKNFKHKTVLLITHRMSVLEAMDRVIYMEEGKIVEDGSPEELRSLKGKYAALLELQKLKK
jgi:ATP-binding cassette subfamily B protein